VRIDGHIVHRHRFREWVVHLNGRDQGPSRVATQTCACGRVLWADRFCEDCGLCSKCCTCEAISLDEE
jgi:hypothetical protein